MHPVLAAGAAVAIPLVWMALNRAATAGGEPMCQPAAHVDSPVPRTLRRALPLSNFPCLPLPAALGDFGPVLLLSGAIAAAATAIAWLVRWGE